MQKDIGQYGAGISRNLFGKLGGTIRAFLLCLILAVAVTAVDTVVDPGMAEAAISKNECSAEGQPPCPIRYKGTVCDSGLGNIDGLCRKCGREGQHACPKSVKGKPCLGGRMKIDGRCYAKCGGADQKACNKAKKGYPCRGKYEPDSKGFCKPCGGANQNACRALKAGEQCNPGTTKHKGICKPCGNRGQQACPALAKGYPCKGRNEPDSRGICAPCGGNGQKACRALKAGKQCDAGTRKLGGECFSCGAHGQVPCPGLAAGKRCEAGTKKIGSTCQRCGGANERACPKLATGYPCRGKYRPDSSNICKPCGGVGEPSCRVFKAGRQCAEWSTSRKGQCVPCGDRNQDACRITDKGKPCKPGLKRELGGTCVLTPAGMVRQAALVQLSKDSKSLTAMLRKGSELNSDEDLKNGIRKGAETASDNEDAGRSTRSARSSNAGGGSAAIRTLDPRNDRFSGDRPKPICPAGTNTWSIGVGVEAGLIVNFEGEAGMAFNCGGNRADTKDAKWYFSKSLNFRLGGGASGGFTLSFWTVDVSQLRGKSHGYVLDVIEAVENMTGMSKEVKALMTGDIKKIKKALGAVSPELTIGVWFERRNEDGEGVGWIKENDVGRFLGYTITFTKGVGWDAGGAHILATTEQICTVDMKCAEGTWAGKIDRRNGTIYVDRQTKDHVYASINGGAPMKLDRVTEAGRKYRVGDSGHQIRYRHNFTELQYRSGNSGSWSKNFSLAKDPTLAGVYSLNRGSQNMVSLVVDNVQNKGFHAQLNHGQRQRFTRKRGKNLVYTGGGATITFRNEFRKVNYRGQDGIGYELTRGSADDIVGGGTFSHSALRGEWNMRVPGGRTVVEDVTDSNAEKIEVKRAGTEFVRTYNLTGDRNDGTYEYTSDAGGRFRFISPTRGIWISGDGQTVFQMQKK